VERPGRFDSLERRARESEALLDAVLKAAVDAIVMIDERGRIELFSQAAERMFGWEAKDVVGRNVSLLMPDPYRAGHDGYLEQYLRTGTPRIIGIGRQAVAVRRDGTHFPVELAVGEIASFGTGRRFVGLIRDTTEKVRAEKEARIHRERLAHVTRLSTLGEMAAGIAHEVNQPLTAISAYAQALARRLRKEPHGPRDGLDTVEKIAEQALRAGEILRRLREFARKGETTRTDCDLNRLVLDVLRLAEVDARNHDVAVTAELAPDLPLIPADEIQIQQVVLNLVRNGVESMGGGGTGPRSLAVRTRATEGGGVEVSVSDHGGGVDPGVEDQLFLPFFTTKRSGMGLGLSISQSIVTAHGGALAFSRNAEGGSTFRFTLPAGTGAKS
jgi:two-component system sensor kinase FixL